MLTPARILQVLPSLEAGGVERGAVEIAQAIVAAGGEALVASSGGRLVAAVRRAGGRHVALPLAAKNPIAMLRNAAGLARLIAAERPALVHARSRAPAWSAYLAARRTGTPFVTTYHGAYTEDLPGKRLYNAVMARGDRVIAISRYIADLVRTRHGVGPEPGTASGRTGCGSSRAAWTRLSSTPIASATSGDGAWPKRGGCPPALPWFCCPRG